MKGFLSGLRRRILTLAAVLVILAVGVGVPTVVAATATPVGIFSPGLPNLSGNGTAGQVAFFTSSTDIGSDLNLYWDNTTKRLGIGTSTPARLLSLKGNVCLFERDVNSAGFIIDRNGGDVTVPNRWVFGVDEPTGFVIKTYPWDGANGTQVWEQLVISKDDPNTPENEGKVGIGITSPQYKLDVRANSGISVFGQNAATGNYGFLADDVCGVYGGSSTFGVYGRSTVNNNFGYLGSSGEGVFGRHDASGNWGSLGSSNYGVFGFSTSGYAGYFNGSVYASGNVGIGTTIPQNKLDVQTDPGAAIRGLNLGSGNYGIVGTPFSGLFGFSDSGNGVSGNSTTGIGVFGINTNSGNYGRLGTPGSGVYGMNASNGYYGVLGGTGSGVFGYSTAGTGVSGNSTSSYGVSGNSISGKGVYGKGDTGVYGTSDGNNPGVWGTKSAGTAPGVYGFSPYWGAYGYSPAGVGVAGDSDTGWAGYFYGHVNVTGTTYTANLETTGVKNFVAPDPSDLTQNIYFAAVEGPEAGTYIRGSAELVGGQAIIELPGYFADVTADEGLTIQLTPVGKWLQLYVVEKSTTRIVVAEATGQSGSFDYLINGVRKGYEDYQVVRDRSLSPAVSTNEYAMPK